MISTSNLNKIYSTEEVETTALNNVNIKINECEFVSIMGPSGCGKTTFLNIVGGLDIPTEGKVEIDGVDISTYKGEEMTSFRRDNIGYVFQLFNLFDYMSAL
ncbi:MAG: ATP-binding cassette domain-containing protein, partial [Melioribacteraceae bacterium]|nr:ATP-binding cassette domain-containing protein [Melioribacteraceae bacterium]